MSIFKDELHDEFGHWSLAYTASGGPEFGDIRAIARVDEAQAVLAVGHVASAGAAYLDCWTNSVRFPERCTP